MFHYRFLHSMLFGIITSSLISCASPRSPYTTGDGFKIGKISNQSEQMSFKCPHGGAIQLLFLIPTNSINLTNISGRVSVSESARILWSSDFAGPTMRKCTSWLRDDLSQFYQAFGLHERALDPYVQAGHTYTVIVSNAVPLPEGSMLYLFRLPWYNMILP